MVIKIPDAMGDLGAVGIVVIAVLIGLAVHWVSWRIALQLVGRTPSRLDEFVVHRTLNPMRLLVVLATVFVSSVFMGAEAADFVRRVAIFLGIIDLGWLLVSLTLVGQDVASDRFPDDVDDLEARQLRTQLAVLQRFGSIIIWLLAVAIALLTIPGVQPLAASLLAGAGVLGIVLGVAAGPLIGNLIAGVQIAFTQPIKIGDVVVIEGEWGHIGEITAAYVVVYIWDKRRLIVPLSTDRQPARRELDAPDQGPAGYGQDLPRLPRAHRRDPHRIQAHPRRVRAVGRRGLERAGDRC